MCNLLSRYMCNGALLDFLRKETDSGGRLAFDSLISISAQVGGREGEGEEFYPIRPVTLFVLFRWPVGWLTWRGRD